MKVKINLISKRSKGSRNTGLVFRVLSYLFIIIFLAFLASVMYVLIKIYSLNNELKKVNLETIAVSGEIRANNENVNKYVLSKGILDYITLLEKSKFDYKKYLDEIVAIVPKDSVLRNVDFTVKGWVAATVFLPNISALKNFEERVMDSTIIEQTVFSTIFSEGIFFEKTGGYSIKLQLELRKNV